MIHRAPFGSLDLFTAVLIEHTGGHFPLWLMPDQCVILPISERFNDYAHKVKEQLEAAGIRANIDERNEKVGRKIRDNEMKHIPYLLVVGEKEQADGSVNVRKQGEGTQETMTIPMFAEKVLKEVAELTEKYWSREQICEVQGKNIESTLYFTNLLLLLPPNL